MGNLGDLSPQGSVAVGIFVGLVSTSLQAIGLTLQRKSHMLEDEKPTHDVRRPPYKRRRWQLGMAMFVISNIVGSTIQITTLPLPVLSTLQASGLVFNTIFATIILGEPFTRYSFIGTFLVCIGAILIATFGAIGEPAHTLAQLLYLLQRRAFCVWMGGTLLLVALILLGSKLLMYLPGSRVIPSHFTSHQQHQQRRHNRMKLIRGMCYGSVSGILSAHSLLLAKSAVELLVRTIANGDNQFTHWQSWVILLMLIGMALTQLYFLHRGLKLCSTSVLYPFVFCIYNIIAILDGLIYFRQASQLTGFHAGLIALGTIILLGGVLCLSWRLEDIDSHAGVTVVGSTQTGLGPGMAVVEEHSPTSSGLLDSAGDEESWIGEREPLLQGNSRARFPRIRAPSLPVIPPLNRHEAADLNAASIWAELDDSDYHFAHPLARSATEQIRGSPGSGAALNGLKRHLTVGPMSYNRQRGTHRNRKISQESPWRRISTPWAIITGSQRRRPDQDSGYGTIQGDDLEPQASPQARENSASLLVGSRRTLHGAWQYGRQYLPRWPWRNPQAGSLPDRDADAQDGAYSSLLPQTDSLPWIRRIPDHADINGLAKPPSSL
ncbi:Magnesium transporter NIPA [Penicillium taxi]|uniref:Magnesium transporter NIPA n=1 Tax=Penicillium taxi TaxID=168475 RepID=UPI00254577AF|nr:Magnesium transporter NIPA [Penicillium taxi]KAJ5887425.1 Magnesium transporter NIPA [Penicillium taxi]